MVYVKWEYKQPEYQMLMFQKVLQKVLHKVLQKVLHNVPIQFVQVFCVA